MFPWLIFPFSDYQRDCMHTTLALSNPCCTQQRFFDIGHRMSCVLTSFDRGTRAQRLRVADRPAVTIDDVSALHPDSPANRYRWQSDSKPKIKLTVYYWTKIIGFKCCFVVFRLLKFFFFIIVFCSRLESGRPSWPKQVLRRLVVALPRWENFWGRFGDSFPSQSFKTIFFIV